MTIHSGAEYSCPHCGMDFIPYLSHGRQKCPECQAFVPEAEIDREFFDTCCRSLTYDLDNFWSFEPPAWIPNSTGDRVIGDAARILNSFIHFWSTDDLGRRLNESPDLSTTLLGNFDTWSQSNHIESLALYSDMQSWIGYVKDLSRAVLKSILPERTESLVQTAAQDLYDHKDVEAAQKVLRMFFIEHEASPGIWSAAMDTSMDLWALNRWPLIASVAITDFEAAREHFGEAPEVLGMLADVGFAATVSEKWEQAVFYYSKALDLHEKAIQEFRPTGFLSSPTFIYKVDISKNPRSALAGPTRRQYFSEQTHSDLHAGLAKAYRKLQEYDLAITNLQAAADSAPSEVEYKYWSKLSLPFRVGVFRESRAEYISLAGQLRRAKHSPLRFVDRLKGWNR